MAYSSNFNEWLRGREQATRDPLWAPRPLPSQSTVPNNAEQNPLLDFFLHKTHRGMTKWIHYFDAYLPHLRALNDKSSIRVLEIGVFSGGSLEMYRHFFSGKELHIVGVDINEECRSFAAPDTDIEIGDQEDLAFWQQFKTRHAAFDLIVDDGGHSCEQQIATFESLFDLLNPGGVYIVEDIGGSSNNRFLAYLSGLLTLLNHIATGGKGEPAPRQIQNAVAKIEFIPGCVFITKRPETQPIQFWCPWIGTSWTRAAEALFRANNGGRLPPTT